MSEHSVKELLDRWQAGDQAAATELYTRFAQRLCRLADRELGPQIRRRIGAEDIVQSVFRSFFRRSQAGEFVIDQTTSLWKLLVTITLNKVRLQGEHHGAQKRAVGKEIHSNDQGALLRAAIVRDPTPSEVIALREELDALFARLKPQAAEILRLCLDGHATPEIAEALRCSRWTVRRELDRIGRQLEARLRPAPEASRTNS